MRKMLKDKKGFTLVELMIVVVIMGILVAVAIPVYNNVTKNARKKTCGTNRSTITTNLSQYQMTGSDAGDEIAWATVAGTFTEGGTYAAMPAKFTDLFNGGLPTCPTEKAAYSIVVTPTDTGTGAIVVQCTGTEEADHNAA